MRLESDTIRQIIRLLNLGNSQRKIENLLSVTRRTVSKIYTFLKINPISNQDLLNISDAKLLEHLEINRNINYGTKKIRPDWSHIVYELKKRDMTRELLWNEYINTYQNGLSYARFCTLLNQFKNQRHASMRQHFKSGETLLVDFCGRTANITNPIDGSISKVQVFVSVLGASGYIFAYAVPSQKIEHWLDCFIKAFEHFGGVPDTIITDNLKSAVICNNRHKLQLQKDFEDLAAYYDFAIIPTRPRKPQDKGLAEVSVRIVQSSILAALRHTKFFSIHELNEEITQRVDIINKKTTRRFTISRFDQFEGLDKKDLRPLPANRYDICQWIRHVRVTEFYRITYKTNQYSVPHQYIHSYVDFKISNNKVYVYFERELIAEHHLSTESHQDIYLDEHMPANHILQKGLTRDAIFYWAKSVGPHTSNYIKNILDQKRELARKIKSLNSFRQWVLENQKSNCLEEACLYAIQRNIYTLDRLKKIIQNGAYVITGFETSSTNQKPGLVHKNIRGMKYYLDQLGNKHAQ